MFMYARRTSLAACTLPLLTQQTNMVAAMWSHVLSVAKLHLVVASLHIRRLNGHLASTRPA